MDDIKQLCPKCSKGYHSESECPELDDFSAQNPVLPPPSPPKGVEDSGTSSQSGPFFNGADTHQDSLISQSKNNIRHQFTAGASPEVDKLTGEITAFRGNFPEGIVVAVFGIASCGKTFLNSRLSKLMIGDGDDHILVEEIDPSPRSQFSTHAFKMLEGDEVQQALLVIDVPGERIIDVSHGTDDKMFEVVRSAMDILVLYISSDCFKKGEEDAFPWNKEKVAGPSGREITLSTAYEQLLHICEEGVVERTRGKVPIPVLVCLSKADLLLGEDALKGEEALACLTAEKSFMEARDHVARIAPALFTLLSNSFTAYSFGLVASHVGAPESKAKETLPSFGVGGLLEVLLKMQIARKKNVPEPTNLFWSYDQATIGKTYPKAVKNRGTHTSLFLRSLDWLIINLNLVPKTGVGLLSLGSRGRRYFSLVLASIVLAIFGYNSIQLARDYTRENLSNIDQQIQQVIDENQLPEHFKVSPNAAWKFTEKQINEWIAEIKAGTPESFGLGHYPLLGPPDPNRQIGCENNNTTIEAFNWRPIQSDNGEQIEKNYAVYRRCEVRPPSAMKECLNDTLMEPVKNYTDDNMRASCYMQALYHYWRADSSNDTSEEVRSSLEKFQDRMLSTFGDSPTNPVKEGYLPFTAAGLILAHTQFVTDKDQTGVLEPYGSELKAALSGGPFSGTGFVHNKDSLAAIGVNQTRLAYHLFAAELITGEDVSDVLKSFDDSLKKIGLTRETALSQMRADASADLYPKLACLLESGIFTEAGGAAEPRYSSIRICTKASDQAYFSDADQNGHANMFVERGAIANPKTWHPSQASDESKTRNIRYSHYLEAIQEAAQERLKRPQAHSLKVEVDALKKLIKFKKLNPLTSLISGWPLFCLGTGVALALLTFWLTSRFLALNRVASLRAFKTWRDN